MPGMSYSDNEMYMEKGRGSELIVRTWGKAFIVNY